MEALPPLLRDFAGLTDIFARRDPHVRELLIQFPLGLDGLVGAFAGGRMQTNMLISDGEVCSYGVEDSNPQLTDRSPAARPGPVVPGLVRRTAARIGARSRTDALTGRATQSRL